MTVPQLQMLLLLASLTGRCAASPRQEIDVKAGEMVVLQCQRAGHLDHRPVIWTSENKPQMDLSNMSPAEQRQLGLLCFDRSLFILAASVNHQGNYSCSQRNEKDQLWFRLIVYNTLTRELENRTRYPMRCYTQESCKLKCPDVNIPPSNSPNFTSRDITWHKEGESAQEVNGYFPSAEDTDRGVYTCTRSYLFDGQMYNMSYTVVLDVQPNQRNSDKHAVISYPPANETIYVDVGSPAVIKCEAVLYSAWSSLFWLKGNAFVERNDSFPVFSNSTREDMTEGVKNTVNLVFKRVTKDDLANDYTCKMQVSGYPSFVTITLAKNVRPFHMSVVLCPVIIVVVMATTVIVYVKFKIEIILFLRDTLGCHRRTADGKTYDVFLMCYKSDKVPGLKQCDVRGLENVLEDNLGYKLCLFDRDVHPGKAVPEALLDCIERSQSVVLVPSTAAQSLETGLLSAIHAALVERKTSLVVIKPECAEGPKWDSMQEAFQLLEKTGNCVTWKGLSSLPPSSAFWKELRYHLPAACTGNKAFPLEALPC